MFNITHYQRNANKTTMRYHFTPVRMAAIQKSAAAAAAAAAAAKSLQSCLTLCSPIDRSPPDSAVPGILQAKTVEWVVISFSNAWKWKLKVKLLSRVRLESEVAQSCPTLSDSMDCSLRGSSVRGIFQAKALEWGAISLGPIKEVSHEFWKKSMSCKYQRAIIQSSVYC